MYFDNLAQLWQMDGHGPYVWGAYAIVLLVLIWLVRAPLEGKTIRVGGLVVPGSLSRSDSGLEVGFTVTDNQAELKIAYQGILPDLFAEGQGIVANGELLADGSFRATQVLAKHDENYMPPEVHEALKAGQTMDEASSGGRGDGR